MSESLDNTLLAIDVGNSRMKFGLFEPENSPGSNSVWPECREFMAVPIGEAIPQETISGWIGGKLTTTVVVSGSNPPAIQRLLDAWDLTSPPLVIRHHSEIPVTADVDYPDRVGLDRLLNAVAVNVIRPAGRAAIVIDSGTATTVDLVSQEGNFCGGAILPGMELGAKSLHDYTALLPLLPVQQLGGTDPVAPGRNTHDAIRNGLFWGQVGAIRELIRQLCMRQKLTNPEQAHGVEEAPLLILTGGGGPVLTPQFPNAVRIASLAMHGLVLTAWRNIAAK